MGLRRLGATLTLALLGVALGFAAGHLVREEPTTLARAAPVPAHDPSIPVDPERDYAPDIDYPALRPSLAYRSHTLGAPPFTWRYPVPRGWRPFPIDVNEVRWRPPGEPEVGGYSLRVKLTSEHKAKEDMVAQKLAAMQAGYDDVEVLGRTGDLLSFSYRESATNVHRFNTFRWFSIPGTTEAKFEMSVVGREVDRPGLDDLFDAVARGIVKVGQPGPTT